MTRSTHPGLRSTALATLHAPASHARALKQLAAVVSWSTVRAWPTNGSSAVAMVNSSSFNQIRAQLTADSALTGARTLHSDMPSLETVRQAWQFVMDGPAAGGKLKCATPRWI